MSDPYGRNFPGNNPKEPKLFNPFRVFRYFLYIFLAMIRGYLDFSNFWENELYALGYVFSFALLIAGCVMSFMCLGWLGGGSIIVGFIFLISFLYAGFHLDDEKHWNLLKEKLLK